MVTLAPTTHPSLENLVRLFAAHTLPTPNVCAQTDLVSATTTDDDDDAEEEVFRVDRNFYRTLHDEITDVAPYLTFPEATGTDLSCTELEQFIADISKAARRLNDKLPIKDAAGLSGFMNAYVIMPLNLLIDLTLPDLPGTLVWNEQGQNSAAGVAPVWTLEWSPSAGTTHAISQMGFTESFFVCSTEMRDIFDCATAIGYYFPEPVDDVSVADGCKAASTSREILIERMLLVFGDGKQWLPGNVELVHGNHPCTVWSMGEPIAFTGTVDPNNLGTSTLGLLFGITLLALRQHGVFVSRYSAKGGAPRVWQTGQAQPASSQQSTKGAGNNAPASGQAPASTVSNHETNAAAADAAAKSTAATATALKDTAGTTTSASNDAVANSSATSTVANTVASGTLVNPVTASTTVPNTAGTSSAITNTFAASPAATNNVAMTSAAASCAATDSSVDKVETATAATTATNTADTPIASTTAVPATGQAPDNVSNQCATPAPLSESPQEESSQSSPLDPTLPIKIKAPNWCNSITLSPYPYLYPYLSKEAADAKQNPTLYLDPIRTGDINETYSVSFTPIRRCDCASEDRHSTRLFAKLYSIDYKDRFGYYLGAKEKFETEIQMLTGRFRELQGSVVPRFYGGWRSDEGTFILVMDNEGEPPSAEQRKNTALQLQVRQAIKAIVKTGVLHEDLEWEHVLCRDDQVRICGLGNGWFGAEEEWEKRADEQVDRLFERIEERTSVELGGW